MMALRRLGILGGTFDPIHYGHLEAADAARRALQLDQVLLIPSSDPPHRPAEPMASGFHRFALVALAIQGYDALHVSDLELTRTGPSYTADTLRAIARQGWTPSHGAASGTRSTTSLPAASPCWSARTTWRRQSSATGSR